jgi:hypothetical protein
MRAFFQTIALTVGCILSAAVLPACADNVGTEQADSPSVVSEALDSAHTRVIEECSQAMSGSWTTYNSTNWPTSTTYGSYAYISNDLGAWGLLLDNTYNGLTRGWWTSCRSTSSVQNYAPCSSTYTHYGDLDTASLYDCQGTCTSGIHHHGGQCKPFMNLVAYRSGLYQNPNYAWKAFPTDTCITNTTASCNTGTKVLRPVTDADMPTVANTTLIPGDYLRLPGGHAAIVVNIANSPNIVVLDSNYVGGDGTETIASHTMTLTQLAAYRVLKCAYAGTPNPC